MGDSKADRGFRSQEPSASLRKGGGMAGRDEGRIPLLRHLPARRLSDGGEGAGGTRAIGRCRARKGALRSGPHRGRRVHHGAAGGLVYISPRADEGAGSGGSPRTRPVVQRAWSARFANTHAMATIWWRSSCASSAARSRVYHFAPVLRPPPPSPITSFGHSPH